MLLDDESTWPSAVLGYLDRNRELLEGRGRTTLDEWDDRLAEEVRRRDSAIRELDRLLRAHTLSSGYHCTRLTDVEIDGIVQSGLQLPNEHTLRARIESLEQQGLVPSRVATTLASENQAGAQNRAGRIWFCFFEPNRAGQRGIERFFRHWGGEALYNTHEDDPEMSAVLRSIGTPCIIEVDVPIASLRPTCGLALSVASRYFARSPHAREHLDGADYEDCAVTPLPPETVRRIVRFPDREFIKLTACNTWGPALPT